MGTIWSVAQDFANRREMEQRSWPRTILAAPGHLQLTMPTHQPLHCQLQMWQQIDLISTFGFGPEQAKFSIRWLAGTTRVKPPDNGPSAASQTRISA